jgi:hypothetical protein
MTENTSNGWGARIVVVFLLAILFCAVMALVLFATSDGAQASECMKSPAAVWDQHPTSWAIKKAPGCWRDSAAKPTTRGNRGHTKRKEARHVEPSEPKTLVKPSPPFPQTVTGAAIPPLVGDNLSAELHRCFEAWDKRHVGGN